jgi:hypothetical protein
MLLRGRAAGVDRLGHRTGRAEGPAPAPAAARAAGAEDGLNLADEALLGNREFLEKVLASTE